jgi:hypothetical protein
MSATVTTGKNLAAAPDPALAFEKQTEGIRRLIWLYLILWMIEGGLRRWILPGLATPLLLVRDPVVIAIYFLAITKNVFPFNGFITFGALLAVLSFINAMLLGHGNALVALYGMRCDFLHVPLIFIMARVLRQKHLVALARVAVCVAIPYTFLLVGQFYEPQDSWINRGVGDGSEGAGFDGALGRFRPPGTFTFITGPAELYPIFTACWCMLILLNRIPGWLTLASGAAILIAIPLSISRLFFVNVAIVAVAGVVALVAGRRFSGGMLFRVLLVVVLLPILASQIPAFKDGMEAFTARWETSTTDQGGIQGSIVDRMMGDLFGKFDGAQFSSLGTGFSTNVGQKLLTGDVGFGASEGEWGRLLYDNGLILGTMFIAYRTALVSYIVFMALKAWRRRAPQSLVFASAGFLLLLNGQWGQASTLGAAMIVGGLSLAAAAMGDKPAGFKSKSRKNRLSHRTKRNRLIHATT